MRGMLSKRGKTMTKNEKESILALQQSGMGYKKIATTLGLPVNGVKTFCRRHADPSPQEGVCPQCGKKLIQLPHKKAKKFCSDKCRMAWWNSHPELVKRKAIYTLTCAHCGKTFESYGNSHRIYCSRSCYAQARRPSDD